MVQINGVNNIADSIVENALPIQDVDQSSFDDMSGEPELVETNILVHIHDPDDENMPSQRFSTGMFVAFFLAFIVISGILAMVVIYLSKISEKRKSSTSQRMKDKSRKSLKDNLECKPWSGVWNHKTELMKDESFSMSRLSTSSEESNGDDNDSSVPPASPSRCSSNSPSNDVECGGGCCNDTATGICALCTKSFEYGQPVYEGNNPQCSHVFHTVCMDKWLQYQNTCPTCNEPFIVQTV